MSTHFRCTLLFIGLVVVCCAGPRASAQMVLVSNIEQPTRATTILDAGLWTAQSFVTDANSHVLSSIDTCLAISPARPLSWPNCGPMMACQTSARP